MKRKYSAAAVGEALRSDHQWIWRTGGRGGGAQTDPWGPSVMNLNLSGLCGGFNPVHMMKTRPG